MKLEKKETNFITENIKEFVEEKESQPIVEGFELSKDAQVEIPILSAQALKDIEDNEKRIAKALEPVEKATQELVDDTKKKKEEAAKKSAALSESYLNENFEGRWTKQEESYIVQCKGRKDLRQLIAEAKANEIKYKFDKLLEGEYRYNFIYTLPILEEGMEDKVIRTTLAFTKDKGQIPCNKGAQQEEVEKILKNNGYKVEVLPGKGGSVNIKYCKNCNESYDDTVETTRDGEKDNEYLVIPGNRTGYGIDQVEDMTCTVGELKAALEDYDDNLKVVISNDNEYTFGYFNPEEWYRKIIMDITEEEPPVNESLTEEKDFQILVTAEDDLSTAGATTPQACAWKVPKGADLKEFAKKCFNGECDNSLLIRDFYNEEHSDYELNTSKKEIVLFDENDNQEEVFKYDFLIIEKEIDESLEESTCSDMSDETKKETEKTNSLTESFDLKGTLKNYVPYDNAVAIWEEITNAGKVDEFADVLEDLYPNGMTIEELNNFLSTKETIVRTLLDLNAPTVETEKEVEIETEPEFETVTEKDFESEDDNVEDIKSLLDNEENPEEIKKDAEKYLSDSTGFDEEDIDEDDTSDIDSLVK